MRLADLGAAGPGEMDFLKTGRLNLLQIGLGHVAAKAIGIDADEAQHHLLLRRGQLIGDSFRRQQLGLAGICSDDFLGVSPVSSCLF